MFNLKDEEGDDEKHSENMEIETKPIENKRKSRKCEPKREKCLSRRSHIQNGEPIKNFADLMTYSCNLFPSSHLCDPKVSGVIFETFCILILSTP